MKMLYNLSITNNQIILQLGTLQLAHLHKNIAHFSLSPCMTDLNRTELQTILKLFCEMSTL